MYHNQQSISAVYFLGKNIGKKTPEMCLFFKQSEGSTGPDDSNFGPKQGGGDNENKTLSMLPNKKRKQALAGLRGSKF